MLNRRIGRPFSVGLYLVLIITAMSVTILLSIQHQMGWAAVVRCPVEITSCHGTSGDDIIFPPPLGGSIINGFAGNDYIIGGTGPNPHYIYGDDGNDILIGGGADDVLFGGRGDDKYDGGQGSDTIYEEVFIEGSLVSNDDVISGGPGDDYIGSGEGSDRINGGKGNDQIYPNAHIFHDFSYDFVDCGPGTGDKVLSFYSSDGETAVNCESVQDMDR